MNQRAALIIGAVCLCGAIGCPKKGEPPSRTATTALVETKKAEPAGETTPAEKPETSPASKPLADPPKSPLSKGGTSASPAESAEQKPPDEAGAAATMPGSDEAITLEDFFENGNLRMRREVKVGTDGKYISHGVTREWSEAGTLWKETFYVDGVKHGWYSEWYQDGQLGQQGEFDHGNMIGTWTWWHKTGQKDKEGTFNKDRQRHGVWTYWDQNGHKLRDETWVNGQLQRAQ